MKKDKIYVGLKVISTYVTYKRSLAMREKMIAKIRQIIVDEKFKLDAYFLCGVASGLPNKELQTACEAYIEAIDHGHAIEVVREKMLEEMEKHLSKEPTLHVRGDLTNNRNDIQEVYDNRHHL
jgi:hypothetical protein